MLVAVVAAGVTHLILLELPVDQALVVMAAGHQQADQMLLQIQVVVEAAGVLAQRLEVTAAPVS
jgi:hypothetical protein